MILVMCWQTTGSSIQEWIWDFSVFHANHLSIDNPVFAAYFSALLVLCWKISCSLGGDNGTRIYIMGPGRCCRTSERRISSWASRALGATWHSWARVLGVLELLGTSPHVLLFPSLGEASGRSLALHAGFR